MQICANYNQAKETNTEGTTVPWLLDCKKRLKSPAKWMYTSRRGDQSCRGTTFLPNGPQKRAKGSVKNAPKKA